MIIVELDKTKMAVHDKETDLEKSLENLRQVKKSFEGLKADLKLSHEDLKQSCEDLKKCRTNLDQSSEERRQAEDALESLKSEGREHLLMGGVRAEKEAETIRTLNERVLSLEEESAATKILNDELKKSLSIAKRDQDAIYAKTKTLEEKTVSLIEVHKVELNALQGTKGNGEGVILALRDEICTLKKGQLNCDSNPAHRLQCEIERNIDLQQIVDNVASEDPSAPGHARKLRKEKVEAECSLVNAQYEIKSLKRKLERSQAGTNVARSNSDANRQLRESETQYESLQTKHKLCVNELNVCLAKVQELECKEKRGAPPTSSLVHEELQKSQEREKNLRQQLQQASDDMKDNITRITELEEQLTISLQSLHNMEDTISDLQSEKGKLHKEQSSASELREEVTQLKIDLERKAEKLESRSMTLKELKRAQDGERSRFDIALTDAKANENVIEQLKVALTDQEDTMAAQDKVLSNRDAEVKSLSEELDKITEKYCSYVDKHGDSSRELRDLSKSVTKAESEREELKRDNERLTTDNHQKDVIIRENNQEMKDLERSMAEKRQENIDLKNSVESQVRNEMSDKEKDMTSTVDDLKTKLREKDRDLRKIEKEIHRYEEMLKDMKKKVDEKDREMEVWRQSRDNLVGSLELLMKNQAAEIKDLKVERDASNIKEEVCNQLEEKEGRIQELECKLMHIEQSRSNTPSRGRKRSTLSMLPEFQIIRKQLDQERSDKLEMQRQMQLLQKASDQILGDLKTSNNQLQVQMAALQGIPPPPKPPRVESTFVFDEDKTERHQEMDATPPIAAKALRKSHRKRVGTDDLSTQEDQTPKTRRGRSKQTPVKEELCEDNLMTISEETEQQRPTRKTKKAAKGRIGDIVTAISHSPMTRSAKKLVGTIVDSHSSVDGCEETSKKARRGKRNLYREEVSAPFACAPFVPPTAPHVDVHSIVQRQLRGRRTTLNTDV